MGKKIERRNSTFTWSAPGVKGEKEKKEGGKKSGSSFPLVIPYTRSSKQRGEKGEEGKEEGGEVANISRITASATQSTTFGDPEFGSCAL